MVIGASSAVMPRSDNTARKKRGERSQPGSLPKAQRMIASHFGEVSSKPMIATSLIPALGSLATTAAVSDSKNLALPAISTPVMIRHSHRKPDI